MGETTKFCRVAVSDLIPYINNAKIHTEDQITRIASSIREFGFLNPVLIDAKKNVIAGHGRIMAAKKLGMAEVPCVYVEGLTDAQRKAYILADNRLAEMADWDMDLVQGELEALNEAGFDIDLIGFDMDLPEDDQEAYEDDFDEELPEEPKSEVGQLYQLGEHRLVVGDSTDPEVLKRLMGDSQADLFLTDPPYNVALGYGDSPKVAKIRHRRTDGLKIENDAMSADDFEVFLTRAFRNASASIKKGAAYYCWYASTSQKSTQTALESSQLPPRQILIWVKSSLVMGRQDYHWRHEPCFYGWKDGAAHYFIDDRTQDTVIEDRMPDLNKMKKDEMKALLEDLYKDRMSTTIIHEQKPLANDKHPTMKPIKLLARLIKNSSKPGWTVLDTFGGSGSTMIACEQLGRKCCMVELDPRYADVIIERWESFTGEKAVLLEG